MKRRAATVAGASIHWSSTGRGPRTVILVHGWTCDETSWSGQVPELAKTYRVITVDLPGHGKSETPEAGRLSMDLFARAVEAVRQEAGVERAAMVGHSMGAIVIARYAQVYPDRTVALLLVDGVLLAPEERRGVVESIPPMAGPEGLKAREGFIRSMFSNATAPRIREHILGMMLRAPEATAVNAWKAMGDPASLGAGAVTKPAFGIYAQEEPPPDDSRMLQFTKQFLPSFRYVSMPATGHFLMLERPAEFNRLVLTFLDEQHYGCT